MSALRETRPPVPEDRPAREARRQHASQQKQTKETAKKRQIRKAKEKEALKKLRCQQALDGVPLAESPSETVSGEDDDGSDGEDDDTLSRYDAATGLGDLRDIRPCSSPSGGHPLRSSWSRRRRKGWRRRQAPQREGPPYARPNRRGRPGYPHRSRPRRLRQRLEWWRRRRHRWHRRWREDSRLAGLGGAEDPGRPSG
jgi:hypothetical protein